MTENKQDLLTNIYRNFFSYNLLFDITRNIFTIVMIGIVLFVFLEKYPRTSENILLFIMLFVGVVSYFCFPILSKIRMPTIIKEFHSDNRGYLKFSSKKSEFNDYFENFSDKKEAWNDLIHLIKDNDELVRISATNLLSALFSQIPDKNQAWKDMHQLTIDEDKGVRICAANLLVAAFPHINNKKEAWNDLMRLMHDENKEVRHEIAYSLTNAFGYTINKKPDEMVPSTGVKKAFDLQKEVESTTAKLKDNQDKTQEIEAFLRLPTYKHENLYHASNSLSNVFHHNHYMIKPYSKRIRSSYEKALDLLSQNSENDRNFFIFLPFSEIKENIFEQNNHLALCYLSHLNKNSTLKDFEILSQKSVTLYDFEHSSKKSEKITSKLKHDET